MHLFTGLRHLWCATQQRKKYFFTKKSGQDQKKKSRKQNRTSVVMVTTAAERKAEEKIRFYNQIRRIVQHFSLQVRNHDLSIVFRLFLFVNKVLHDHENHKSTNLT